MFVGPKSASFTTVVTFKSIIDPEGAVKINSPVVTEEFCQKLAKHPFGGTALIKAGMAVETVVSEISELVVVANPEFPAQSMEQVAELPCVAGGVQTFTE